MNDEDQDEMEKWNWSNSPQGDEEGKPYPPGMIFKQGFFRKCKTYPEYVPNRSDMTREQWVRIYNAIAYANYQYGAIMNTHVTILWESLGFDSQDKATEALTENFIKPLGLWYSENLRRLKLVDAPPFFWIYVHENGKVRGFHTHFLTSIPEKMVELFGGEGRGEDRDEGWVRKRLKRLAGVSKLPAGAVRIDTRPSQPINRQWIRFRYICKTIQPDIKIPTQFDRNKVVKLANLVGFAYESPGEINCRVRVSVSRNLSKGYKDNKFWSLLDQKVIDIRWLYSSAYFDVWEEKTKAKKNKPSLISLQSVNNILMGVEQKHPDGQQQQPPAQINVREGRQFSPGALERLEAEEKAEKELRAKSDERRERWKKMKIAPGYESSQLEHGMNLDGNETTAVVE